MRNVELQDNRRWNPVSLCAWGATAVLSLAIAGNAFFGQPTTVRSLAAMDDRPAEGSARFDAHREHARGGQDAVRNDVRDLLLPRLARA